MTEPTDALITVVDFVIAAVKAADLEVDVGSVLKSLTLTCSGSGQFNITVESDAVIDAEKLQATINQALQSETSDERPHPAGPTDHPGDTNQVPGHV